MTRFGGYGNEAYLGAGQDNTQHLSGAAERLFTWIDQLSEDTAAQPSASEYDEFHRIDEVAMYLEENGSRERVTIGEVADRFYDEVERRIKTADYEPPKYGSDMGDISSADKREQASQEAAEHYGQWLDDLSGVHATLEVTKDAGTRHETTYEYELSPRTDFAFDDVQTAPNVIKVMDDDAMRYAIRIWKQYDDDATYDPLTERVDLETVNPDLLGDNFLHRLARHGKKFNRNSHDDTFYETIGTAEYDANAFRGGITMIPELQLETALHKTDGVYDHGVPPITPYNIKVMDVEEDRAFVMRPWLFNVFDGGANSERAKERLATFYGTCQALNLVGCFDRKDELYDEWNGDTTGTVFIDPEMFAYTDRDMWFKGSDWKDFRGQIESYGGVPDSYMDDVSAHRWDVAKTVDEQYDGDILDELPRSIDKDLFPDEKRVDVAAPQN